MKSYKILFAVAVAVLGLARAASATAPIPIYISGAPATRAIWNQGLLNTLAANTPGGLSSITKYWSGGTSTTGYSTANQIVLAGGQISGTAVTIYGSWTGSTGGNQSVAINPPQSNANLEIAFLNSSNLSAAGGGYTLDTSNKQYPLFNLSDTEQTTIPFNGSVTITHPHTSYVSLTETAPSNPAITGFKFVANNGSPSTLNNITTNLANYFFTTSGGTPLSFFTGNTGDEGTLIYPVGRDIASGARYILLTILAETQLTPEASSSLFQYEPAISSGTISNIASNPAPGGTINLINFGVGNGGYSSFTSVLTALSATSIPSIGYFVTYVTDSDAITAENGGAHELAWNGVFYGTAKEGAHGTAPVSIAEGQYTFWSYLHVYYNQTYLLSTSSLSVAKAFADAFGLDLSTDTGTGAILTSDVKVSRAFDGGPVLPLSNY